MLQVKTVAGNYSISVMLRNIQFNASLSCSILLHVTWQVPIYDGVDFSIIDEWRVIMRKKMFCNIPRSAGLLSSYTLKTATAPSGICRHLTGRWSVRCRRRRPTSTRHGLERTPPTFVCTAVTRRLSYPQKQSSRKLPNRSRTLKVRALSASWGHSVERLLLSLKMFNDYSH